MNAELFESLPSDLQESLFAAFQECGKYTAGLYEADIAAAWETFDSFPGTTRYTLTPEETAQWRDVLLEPLKELAIAKYRCEDQIEDSMACKSKFE